MIRDCAKHEICWANVRMYIEWIQEGAKPFDLFECYCSEQTGNCIAEDDTHFNDCHIWEDQ